MNVHTYVYGLLFGASVTETARGVFHVYSPRTQRHEWRVTEDVLHRRAVRRLEQLYRYHERKRALRSAIKEKP